MKFALFSLVPIAFLALVPFTNAGPVSSSSSLNAREPLFDDSSIDNLDARDLQWTTHYGRSRANLVKEREFFNELTEALERRGVATRKMPARVSKTIPKIGKSKHQTAKYKMEKVKPKTPQGQPRGHMAGKKGNYFANCKNIHGMDNPAAGKGKKPRQIKARFMGSEPLGARANEVNKPKPKGSPKVHTTVEKSGSEKMSNPVKDPATESETKAALDKLIEDKKTTLPKPSYQAVTAAAQDLAFRLHAKKVSYYYCGGFACVYLCGSGRTTADIDIVAKDNTNYKTMLETVDAMTNVVSTSAIIPNRPIRLYYHKPTDEFVEMDCLPAGWGGNFPKFDDKGFGLETKDSIDFLKAPELLRLKFKAWADPSRARQVEKNNGDKMDILALRKSLRYPEPSRKVDKSTWGATEKKGLENWIKRYKDSSDWKAIGLA